MSEPIPSIPAASSAAHHYNFTVRMTCSGCSGAVDRVLKRMDGEYYASLSRYHLSTRPYCHCPSQLSTYQNSMRPSLDPLSVSESANGRAPSGSEPVGLNSYNVDLETKKVDVYTDTVEFKDVLEKIRKTGKAVEAAEEDGKTVALE